MMLVPHENVAIHMAAGFAAVTGRGQAVMVHVDAGTANAAMGMHNMFRGRLPVMLIAGKSSTVKSAPLKDGPTVMLLLNWLLKTNPCSSAMTL